MLADAYYDNGKIEFTRNYRFRHSRFSIRIEVPDDEVLKDLDITMEQHRTSGYSLREEVEALSSSLKEKLDRIRNAPAPPDDEFPPLTPKYLERLEAYALRNK
jgi:hypothetical protein